MVHLLHRLYGVDAPEPVTGIILLYNFGYHTQYLRLLNDEERRTLNRLSAHV